MEVINVRGFSGLIVFIFILLILQLAWPWIVVALIYLAIRFIIYNVRIAHQRNQYHQPDDQQQVNEDWANRSYQQSNQQNNANKDVIDVEYTERDADK